MKREEIIPLSIYKNIGSYPDYYDISKKEFDICTAIIDTESLPKPKIFRIATNEGVVYIYLYSSYKGLDEKQIKNINKIGYKFKRISYIDSDKTDHNFCLELVKRRFI